MNTTDNQTRECNPLGLYGHGEPPVSAALLWWALVHVYCVIIIGTLGNALALWCLGTCTKTRRPVKVLLFSVFVPALLVCLATRPVIGEIRVALLTCDPNRISTMVIRINMAAYSILAQIELASIAAVAAVRAVSVSAPQMQTLGLRGTLLLVTAICLYSVLCSVGMMELVVLKEVHHWKTVITVLYFLNTTLPALITAGAYTCMIVVIQRNKRRLAASQHQERQATTMDQATRAMLAVFISNLVFGLPHSIFHLMGKQPHYMNIIFHVLFSTHFIVDPLAFVWCNKSYRRRVFSKMKEVSQSMSSPLSLSSSVFPSDHDHHHHHHHHNHSFNKQEAV